MHAITMNEKDVYEYTGGGNVVHLVKCSTSM